MKVLIALVVMLVGALAIDDNNKTCAPDMYEQGFLQETAVGGEKPGVFRFNVTSFTDFKKKVSVIYLFSESYDVFEYNFFERNISFHLTKINKQMECKRVPLTQTLLQCLPDDTKLVAEYTNMAGRKVKVLEFASNGFTVTQVIEENMPVVQTVKGEDKGVGYYTTQLFTNMATKFNPSVFTLPDSCKKVSQEQDGF